MKVVFIVFETIEDSRGISKKIKYQINAFKELGNEVDLVYYDVYDRVYYRKLGDEKIRTFSKNRYFSFLQRNFSFSDLSKRICEGSYDLVYIRYNHVGTWGFVQFLKDLKDCNQERKIIMEIPTYPYDLEYKQVGVVLKIFHYLEKICRKYYDKYVDYVVTYSDVSEIYKIPCINISNGVDVNAISIVERSELSFNINFIAVASMEFWHGYERLILGLNDYYKSKYSNRKVYLTLVGPSNSVSAKKYKELIEKYNLQNYVFLVGKKSGKELNELFNKANVAVGCLACHRKGISNIKSLKNREYCVRGIPFIYSENDSDFDDKEFVYKITPDESNLNIEEVLMWLDSLEFNQEEIRNYAVRNLTWTKQINKIIEFI